MTKVAPGVWVHKRREAEADADGGCGITNLRFVIGRDGVAEIDESQRENWLLFYAFNQRKATAAFQEMERE